MFHYAARHGAEADFTSGTTAFGADYSEIVVLRSTDNGGRRRTDFRKQVNRSVVRRNFLSGSLQDLRDFAQYTLLITLASPLRLPPFRQSGSHTEEIEVPLERAYEALCRLKRCCSLC
jgi:hypothetical protein